MAINWSGKFVAASFLELTQESEAIKDVIVSTESLSAVAGLADDLASEHGYEFHCLSFVPEIGPVFMFKEVVS